MSRPTSWRVCVPAALAAAVLLCSCGGDSDDADRAPSESPTSQTEATEPALSAPTVTVNPPAVVTDTAPKPQDTRTVTTPTETAEPPPRTDTESAKPRAQDSPEHDTPPAKGSPEERFEQYCKRNPGACG